MNSFIAEDWNSVLRYSLCCLMVKSVLKKLQLQNFLFLQICATSMVLTILVPVMTKNKILLLAPW